MNLISSYENKLIEAIKENDFDEVKHLINNYANFVKINEQSYDTCTALQTAIEEDRKDIVEFLIKNNMCKNTDILVNALVFLSNRDNIELVNSIVNYLQNQNQLTEQCVCNALQGAINGGNINIIEYLINLDICRDEDILNNVLVLLSGNCKIKSVEKILKIIIDIKPKIICNSILFAIDKLENVHDNEKKQIQLNIIEKLLYTNKCNKLKIFNSLLIMASEYNNINIIDYILSKNIVNNDITFCNALVFSSFHNYTDIVKKLLNTNICNDYKIFYKILINAVSNNNFYIVKKILKKTYKLSISPKGFWNKLMGKLDIPNEEFENLYYELLNITIRNNNYDIFEYLLDNLYKFEIRCNDNLVLNALSENREKMIEDLVRKCHNSNEKINLVKLKIKNEDIPKLDEIYNSIKYHKVDEFEINNYNDNEEDDKRSTKAHGRRKKKVKKHIDNTY